MFNTRKFHRVFYCESVDPAMLQAKIDNTIDREDKVALMLLQRFFEKGVIDRMRDGIYHVHVRERRQKVFSYRVHFSSTE